MTDRYDLVLIVTIDIFGPKPFLFSERNIASFEKERFRCTSKLSLKKISVIFRSVKLYVSLYVLTCI